MYINGEVQILLNNHVFNVKKGDVVIIPPYYIHSLIPTKLENPYERMYLYITEACLASFQFNEHSLLKPLLNTIKINRFHYYIDDQKDYERITYVIDKIRDSKRVDYFGKELMNRSYITQLFVIINSYITRENQETVLNETSSPISQIISYINENFHRNITLNHYVNTFIQIGIQFQSYSRNIQH